MFVNFQHPGGHATAEQFAAGAMGSVWPDGDAAIPPRSANFLAMNKLASVRLWIEFYESAA